MSVHFTAFQMDPTVAKYSTLAAAWQEFHTLQIAYIWHGSSIETSSLWISFLYRLIYYWPCGVMDTLSSVLLCCRAATTHLCGSAGAYQYKCLMDCFFPLLQHYYQIGHWVHFLKFYLSKLWLFCWLHSASPDSTEDSSHFVQEYCFITYRGHWNLISNWRMPWLPWNIEVASTKVHWPAYFKSSGPSCSTRP